MEEIEEVLSKDSRYHVLEVLNDDRADLLMTYLEDLERKGPPPPPTARTRSWHVDVDTLVVTSYSVAGSVNIM